jgi:hypothetical protein
MFAVVALAVVALVLLLFGHRWIEGVRDEQRRSRSNVPDLPSGAGVAGSVAFADGKPAASARVDISWTDSAGRAGETPDVTDEAGRFAHSRLPTGAKVTEIRVSFGPLSAEADRAALAGEAPAVRAQIVLPSKFRLAGRVRRVGDREPVASAKLEFAGVSTTSDEGGGFRLEEIPASALREGRPTLRVSADGFGTLDWPLPLGDPPETYGDLTLHLEPMK